MNSYTFTYVHIFTIALTFLIGVLVGMIPFPIPGAGTITLGIAGGPLFVALIIGHFGKIGPIHVRYYEPANRVIRSEEHTSELQSRFDLVCRLLLETPNQLSDK